MGKCYLRLSQFDEAYKILNKNIDSQEKEHGADWVQYLA